MTGKLLVRGMLAGLLAALLAFAFARFTGEAAVEQSIALEGQLAHTHDHAAGHDHAAQGDDPAAQAGGEVEEEELVSRETQSTIGLLTAVAVYGTAIGGLFSLVFAFAYGRAGNLRPRELAAWIAAGAFLTFYLVPGLMYPPNPPAVGNPDTIGYRTGLYFSMVLLAVAGLALAVIIGRPLALRLGTWNGSLLAAAIFIVLMGVVHMLLPGINEVPEGFPATLLWQFRIASVGIHVILWSGIGLIFGALAERMLTARPSGSVMVAHQA